MAGVDAERRGTAFHEAGHAVVAWALGCHVNEITISDDAGETSLQCDFRRLCFRDRLALCLAGQVAEILYDAPMHRRSAALDLGEVAQLLTGLDENTSSKLRCSGKVRAEELLREYSEPVERVAKYLMHNDGIDEHTFIKVLLGGV